MYYLRKILGCIKKADEERLLKEKQRLEAEVKRVEGKLSNQGFVAKAPAKLIEEEKEIAKKVYKIMCRHPEVGFEAANHYYYSKGMVMEKIINCNWLIEYYSHC